MTRIIFQICAAILLLFGCGGSGTSEVDSQKNDSLSKVQQRRISDSLRKENPLLIVPPDDDYTGEYVDKYPSGITKFRGQYRFGERHGQWLSFFPTGIAWSEMHYDKGSREGPNIVYFENGKTRYQGFYKNNQQDSIWCFYDSLGNLAEKVLYQKDKIIKHLPLN